MLTRTSQGQAPQVQLVTQPDVIYYVSRKQAANVTCEAYGAVRITFSCAGIPVPAVAQRNYERFEESTGRTLLKSTVQVSAADLAGLREGEEFVCDCTAEDEQGFVAVSSRPAVVAMACEYTAGSGCVGMGGRG